jgi:hypothetical protein
LGIGGYTFTATSPSACKNNAGANSRAAVLAFTMSKTPLPNFKIAALAKGTDSISTFSARFGIDKVVEYIETNNVAGYQANQDQLVKQYSLISTQWSNFDRITIVVDSITTVEKLTTSYTNGGVTFTFGGQISSDEVQFGNVTEVVLTPDSFKTIFSIKNIAYSSANSRLAIGTLLFVKSGATRRTVTSDSESDGDRPDDNTPNQTVVDLPSNSGSSGFFSWQRFVVGTNSGTSVTSTVTLTEAGFTIANDTTVGKSTDETVAGFIVQRNFFSLDAQVTSLDWDPSVGVAENAQNSAVSSGLSIFTMFTVILVALMLM